MVNFVFFVVARLIVLDSVLTQLKWYDVEHADVGDELFIERFGLGLVFEVEDATGEGVREEFGVVLTSCLGRRCGDGFLEGGDVVEPGEHGFFGWGE